MKIPISILEELYQQLPDVNSFDGDCLYKEFIYDQKYFELKFYVASDHGAKLWVYNPLWVQGVTINGSHTVK